MMQRRKEIELIKKYINEHLGIWITASDCAWHSKSTSRFVGYYIVNNYPEAERRMCSSGGAMEYKITINHMEINE